MSEQALDLRRSMQIVRRHKVIVGIFAALVPCQTGFALSDTLILAGLVKADVPKGRRVTAQRCPYPPMSVRDA
jgi:hypothetical protein